MNTLRPFSLNTLGYLPWHSWDPNSLEVGFRLNGTAIGDDLDSSSEEDRIIYSANRGPDGDDLEEAEELSHAGNGEGGDLSREDVQDILRRFWRKGSSGARIIGSNMSPREIKEFDRDKDKFFSNWGD